MKKDNEKEITISGVRYLTREGLRDYLSIKSMTTINKYLKEMMTLKIGNRTLVPIAEVDNFIKKNTN